MQMEKDPIPREEETPLPTEDQKQLLRSLKILPRIRGRLRNTLLPWGAAIQNPQELSLACQEAGDQF